VELEVQNIHKSFADREILHGIQFRVQSGRAMGFLGRNGAGKSTTFRCLMQVFRQDSGEFLLDGQKLDLTKYRVGYLPEERGMYSKVKLKEQLAYFAQLKGEPKNAAMEDSLKWIHYFDLDSYADKTLETLSKGNQQKIQIAQAFLNDPDLIILDEPFSGLDPVNAQVFTGVIKDMVSRGKLVIFSSHQMSYVEDVCDDITLIDEGNILLTGSLEEIKRKVGENRYYFECEPGKTEALVSALSAVGLSVRRQDRRLITEKDEPKIRKVLSDCFDDVLECGTYRPSLQDIFLEYAGGHDAQ
jgi:ABC-2 type transport system ATP-binding protein